jgi:hypothetical protein
MSLAVRAIFIILCLSAPAQSQTRTLALYAGTASGLEDGSVQMLRSDLQRLFSPAGFEFIWKHSPKAGEDFDFVAVSSFEGSCSTAEIPHAHSKTIGSLADTSISNGRVLPFFRVDCSRIVRMLQPQLESLSPRSRQLMIGRALARVMAHELYHIVAGTAEHRDIGVAKAMFSSHDLTAPRFDFDRWTFVRVQVADR